MLNTITTCGRLSTASPCISLASKTADSHSGRSHAERNCALLRTFQNGTKTCADVERPVVLRHSKRKAGKATLKAVFQSELDHAFGLRESKVAGGGDLPSQWVVRGGHHWIVKLRMIECIEQFRPELDLVPLSDP